MRGNSFIGGPGKPSYLQPLFQFKSPVLSERAKNIDFQKIKAGIETKDRSFSNLVRFDVQFYVFSIVQMALINLLIFKSVSSFGTNRLEH